MYVGRFAPSPTGPLHAGSLVAALASWLDARAHEGRWLLRIEDVDTPRCVPGADAHILQQLDACGLLPDEAPLWQSGRGAIYQQALDELVAQELAYPCSCSRKDVEAAHAARGMTRTRGSELPYPGTCRPERSAMEASRRSTPERLPGTGTQHRPAARAWRLHTARASSKPGTRLNAGVNNGFIYWHDRRVGDQQQHVESAVGDFILKRADGLWAYQLAVVVDDAAQGITHVVRGEDLADNTPRQILLQHALDLPTPTYLHTPLVLAADGEKLSKQNGAQALDLTEPLHALQEAARHLRLTPTHGAHTVSEALAAWVQQWRDMFCRTSKQA